jgi:HEAT repeat protein
MQLMLLIGAGRLFLLSALWRHTGFTAAGRALVHALGSPDENIRTIAGMLLVRMRERAVPLLREALARRENLPVALAILGDIGDRRCEPDLVQFTRDGDPEVARAARDALRVLSAR